MPTLNTIREIASEVIAGADKERGYVMEVTETEVGYELELSFITGIKYDKEVDPVIQKEPIVTVVTTCDYLYFNVPENVIREFVADMIEEVEEKGEIKYE